MPNLRLAPAAPAKRAKPRRRRRTTGQHVGHGWLEAAKITFLLQRARRGRRRGRTRSSPSLRQIALVVVSGGIVVVIVRVATQRVKNRAGEREAPSPPPSESDGNPAAPVNESPLTDRVQDEMFHRSDAVRPDE